MPNSRHLLEKLTDYHQSLTRHLDELEAYFPELQKRWKVFRYVYQGDAAEQFRHHWELTEWRFRDYLERSKAIQKMLAERILKLEQYNRPEGGLLS